MEQALFIYNRTQLEELADYAIRYAKASGASDASVRIDESDSLSVKVRNASLDSFQHQRAKRMRVTVLVGTRMGSSHTSDLSMLAVRQAAEAAIAIARHTSEDAHAGMVDAGELATDVADLDLLHPWRLTTEQALEWATELEAHALRNPTRLPQFDSYPEPASGTLSSDGATLSSSHGQFWLATSTGFANGYGYSSHSLSAQVIGTRDSGMQAGYWWSSARAAEELDSIHSVGAAAAFRTLRRLDAQRLASGRYPVLFEAPVAGTIVEELLSAISGASQYRGQSFLPQSLGQTIVASHVDIIEQPRLSKGLASAPFDAEGVATRDQVLVSGGVLQTYLLDGYAARRLQLKTGGHAGGARNVRMRSQNTQPGDNLAALVKRMHTGLLVTELLGGGVNSVTGDYSQGVAGFWVERGVIRHPVEEITIAGSLPQMLLAIVAIAADEPRNSALASGSVLIEHMRIAGL